MHPRPLSVALLLFTVACGAPDAVDRPAPPPAPLATGAPPTAPPATVPEASPLITRNVQAQPLLGQRVRVQGTARDAKLSAVIDDESLQIYCLGQGEDGYVESRWPPEVLDQVVVVTGRLIQTDQFNATVGPEGVMSQGTDGPILGLLEFQHKRLDTTAP